MGVSAGGRKNELQLLDRASYDNCIHIQSLCFTLLVFFFFFIFLRCILQFQLGKSINKIQTDKVI